MTKYSLKIKKTFILVQALIFTSLMILSVSFLVTGYIKKIKNEMKDNLNRLILVASEEIRETQTIPGTAFESDALFIIDQKNGEDILKKRNASLQERELWAQYRSKLTYQMQKQKNGWITYPSKKPFDFSKSVKLLRYAATDDPAWIVIAERTLPGELQLARQVLNRKSLLDMILILLAGLGLIKLVTDIYFSKLQDQIKDSLGNNFFDANKFVEKNKSFESDLEESQLKQKKTAQPYIASVSPKGEEPRASFTKSANKEAPQMFRPEKKEIIKNLSGAPESTGHDSDPKTKKKELLGAKRHPNKKREPLKDIPETEEDSAPQIQKIKSPVLKNMLNELRRIRGSV